MNQEHYRQDMGVPLTMIDPVNYPAENTILDEHKFLCRSKLVYTDLLHVGGPRLSCYSSTTKIMINQLSLYDF